MIRRDWHNCFGAQWGNLLIEAAYEHPAKFSRGLIERIVQHGFDMRWWRAGDLIADPFAGIGAGGIVAADCGLDWFGVELEDKFIHLARCNFDLHARQRWCVCGPAANRYVASQRAAIREYIREHPPEPELGTLFDPLETVLAGYPEPEADDPEESALPRDGQPCPQCGRSRVPLPVVVQGDSREFARLIGQCEAVVTSPPYADAQAHPSLGSTNKDNWGDEGSDIAARRGLSGAYGTTPGQIGRLPAGNVDAVLTSPPWAETLATDSKKFTPYTGRGHYEYSKEVAERRKQGYGTTPGQIGRLPAGKVDAVLTSPPYAPDVVHGRRSKMTDAIFAGRTAQAGLSDYGTTPGQIGKLPVGKVDAVLTSPPYADSVRGEHGETETAAESRDKRRTDGGSLGRSQRHGGYGVTDAQIGRLPAGKVDAVLTSPPWAKCEGANAARKHADPEAVAEKRAEGYRTGRLKGHAASKEAILRSMEKANQQEYGSSLGQIGKEDGDTYWAAVAAVYKQCRIVLKPGGMLVVVVKNYVKNKQIVPLCDDTWKLLVKLGFEPVERIRAHIDETDTQPGLWDETVAEKKKRKGFFRQLTEAQGSPPIDWEEVLCVRRP